MKLSKKRILVLLSIAAIAAGCGKAVDKEGERLGNDIDLAADERSNRDNGGNGGAGGGGGGGGNPPFVGGICANVYDLAFLLQDYASIWDIRMPDFSELTPVENFEMDQIGFPNQLSRRLLPGMPAGFKEWFGLTFDGTLNAVESGVYEFYARTDDGSKIYIDGVELINNDGAHPTREVSAQIYLEAGYHHIRIEYFQGPHPNIALEIFIRRPTGVKVYLSDDILKTECDEFTPRDLLPPEPPRVPDDSDVLPPVDPGVPPSDSDDLLPAEPPVDASDVLPPVQPGNPSDDLLAPQKPKKPGFPPHGVFTGPPINIPVAG